MIDLEAHFWATQQQSINSCNFELSQALDTDEGGSNRLVS